MTTPEQQVPRKEGGEFSLLLVPFAWPLLGTTSLLAPGGKVLWVVLLFLGLGVLLDRRRRTEKENRSTSKSMDEAAEPEKGRPLKSGPSRRDSAMAFAAEVSGQAERSQLFFPDDELGPRSCPQCGRNFPGVFESCPYDNSTLQEGRSLFQSAAIRYLPRKYCRQCTRRFPQSADFCRHDGQPLEEDYSQAAELGEKTYFCRSCGFETQEEQSLCPRDKEPLEVLEPALHQEELPLVPLLECSNCGYMGALGETRCPEDHCFLVPRLSRRPQTLAITGFGPRRKICKECGERYSDQAQYCSFDGAQLVSIH